MVLERREGVEFPELLGDRGGAADPVHPVAEGLTGISFGGETSDHPHRPLGGVLGRESEGLVAEVDAFVADVSAEEHLVAGRRTAVGTALGTEEPDVGHVVLPARVGAPRDVDAQAPDLGEALLLQPVADRLGQTAALGDGQVAGVGARAGDDVAHQLGTGLGHADRFQSFVERRQLVLGEVAEHDVLPVAEADAGAELALDRSQRPELFGGDVAQRCVCIGADRAVGGTTHHVRVVPPHVR